MLNILINYFEFDAKFENKYLPDLQSSQIISLFLLVEKLMKRKINI